MGEVIRKLKDGKFIGWYLRFVDVDGRRKQRASHQPPAALARKMLIEIEARIARGRAGVVDSVEQELTLEALFRRYLEEYSSPRLKNMAAYRTRVGVLFRRVSKHAPQVARLQLGELRPVHIERVRDALSRRYPAGTVRNSIAGISAALSWAERQSLIDKNPARGVEQPPPPPRVDEWLDAEDVRRLLDEARRRGEKDVVWRKRHVAIALGVYLGLRRGEIFGLRWQDVDLKRGRLTVARSYGGLPKNGKPRHLKISAALLPILQAWRPACPVTAENLVCPVRKPSGAWGLSINTTAPRGLPELLKAAGCRPLSRPWHGLRHTFASNFLAQGGSILALQRLLGHSEIRTTMVYSHLAEDFVDAELDRLRY